MTTYPTLDAARADAKPGALRIIEIDHVAAGRCYIQISGLMATLEAALRYKPMPEIARLVAEHDIKTAEQIKAAIERDKRNNCHCERCSVKIDGNHAYHQQEWRRIGSDKVKATIYYCKECATLLRAVGAGEASEMQQRAADVPSYEPAGKDDE